VRGAGGRAVTELECGANNAREYREGGSEDGDRRWLWPEVGAWSWEPGAWSLAVGGWRLALGGWRQGVAEPETVARLATAWAWAPWEVGGQKWGVGRGGGRWEVGVPQIQPIGSAMPWIPNIHAS
jgi:hypothetical protein